MSRFTDIANPVFLPTLLRYVRIFSGVIATTFLVPAHSSELVDYAASYSANYNGIAITAKYQLEQLDADTYSETSEANSIFGKITEKAQFELNTLGQLIPRSYHYKRSLMGVSRRESQLFDWNAGQLTYTKNDTSSVVPVTQGTLDLMTHKLQIRRDLKAAKSTFYYSVMSRDKRKQYNYEVIASEVLTTSLGPLNTTKIRRVVNQDKKRETIIWLADDWEFLIVKLSHVENGDSHELNITKGQIAGRDIVPLEIIQASES